MKALTVGMYLVLAALIVTVILTATSSGRIGWDESAVVLVPLAIAFLALSYFRRRGERRPAA